jgi:hypothetical protein
MHIFTAPLTKTQQHQPPHEIFNGEQEPHQEGRLELKQS